MTGCLAKTPAGFEPASKTDLIVEFSGIAALNGAVLSKEGRYNKRMRRVRALTCDD